MKQEISSFKT